MGPVEYKLILIASTYFAIAAVMIATLVCISRLNHQCHIAKKTSYMRNCARMEYSC